jgi:hypothetical protein
MAPINVENLGPYFNYLTVLNSRYLARVTYYSSYLIFQSAKHADNIFFTSCYKKGNLEGISALNISWNTGIENTLCHKCFCLVQVSETF